MFSKSCKYALRSTLYVATQSLKGIKVGVKDIAENTDIPEHYAGKILQILVKGNVIQSTKGPQGGFFIETQNLNKIKLIQIVILFDGSNIFEGCGLGLKYCDSQLPCLMHDKITVIREALKEMLENNTLHNMIFNKKGDLFEIYFSR
ncbi:MAG: transcriptional regulator [Flavobacteriaceae bacterium]|nr:MAG: transcriptional regulator [Flavobacteriaceae bacterium]